MPSVVSRLPVTQSRTQCPRLLCIDDDRAIIHALQLRLSSHAVEVPQATNGVDGIQLALTQQPDVILTDWRMNRCSGADVLSCLRHKRQTQHTPVIVISGVLQPGLKYEALNLGADSFYAKPLSFHDLVAELVSRLSLRSLSMLPRPRIAQRD